MLEYSALNRNIKTQDCDLHEWQRQSVPYVPAGRYTIATTFCRRIWRKACNKHRDPTRSAQGE